MQRQLLSYKNKARLVAGSGSTSQYIVDWDSRYDERSLLLGAVDPLDANLQITEVDVELYKGEPCNAALLTCTGEPLTQAKIHLPGNPFRVRMRQGSESFTVQGNGWTWATGGGAVVNTAVKPAISMAVTEIELFGTIAAVDLTTFDAYVDKVNSDPFLGAPAGYVLFKGASTEPRYLSDNSEVFDARVILKRRTIDWRKFWNETPASGPAGWDFIKNGSSYYFDSAAFAGLLT